MSTDQPLRSGANVLSAQPTSRIRNISVDLLLAVAVLGDGAFALSGLCLGFWIRYESGWITFGTPSLQPRGFVEYVPLILLGVVFLLVTFLYLRLYHSSYLLQLRRSATTILTGLTLWLFFYLGVSLVLRFDPPISRLHVFFSYLCCLVLLIAWRWGLDRWFHTEAIAKSLRQRVLVVGWTLESERLVSAVRTDPAHPYEIVGCVPSPHGEFAAEPPLGVEKVGALENLESLVVDERISVVVAADLGSDQGVIMDLANRCERLFVRFKVIPSYFEIMASALQLETISGVPVLGIGELPLERTLNRILKRAVDIAGAAFGLVVSIPLIAVFGLLTYLETRGPVFFVQKRIGQNGRSFRMYKLRSMQIGVDALDDVGSTGAGDGKPAWDPRSASPAAGPRQSSVSDDCKLTWNGRFTASSTPTSAVDRDDPRLTRVGTFIRRWNIDETPQFWNVLKGEMSLVGPRPERPFHSETLSSEIRHYNTRYAIKPGMTGWAQVNGFRGGDTSLIQRVQYDLFYLENWSLWQDIQIMILTLVGTRRKY